MRLAVSIVSRVLIRLLMIWGFLVQKSTYRVFILKRKLGESIKLKIAYKIKIFV
jgi:hypothetical protein